MYRKTGKKNADSIEEIGIFSVHNCLPVLSAGTEPRDGIDAVKKKHQSILVNLLIGACVGPGELDSVGRLLDVEPDALPFVLDDLHRPSFRSAEGIGAAGLGLPYQF